MRPLGRFLSIAFMSAVLAAPAAAQTYSFTLTGSFNGFWTLPSTPDFYDNEVIRIYDVVRVMDGSNEVTCDMTFYVIGVGGGVGSCELDLYGAQLFEGPTNASNFIPGTYGLSQGPTAPVSSQLTIAAVPEPSSVALLGVGLAGLTGVARRRKRTVAV